MAKKLGMIILLLSVFCLHHAFAGSKENDSTKEQIHWMTMEEAEQKMQEQPKMVLVDVYTSWCGWCKVMDKKTYTNPALIQYVNEHFYAVKFNAEQKETIHFMGKDWSYDKQNRVNQLAIDLLHGRLSYPTTVIMGQNFKSAEPIPGYLEVPVMESILKFFGDNNYLHVSWPDYKKNFVNTWDTGGKK